ncbi:hypothetical protein M408DRAFT_28127 [Serendipita vermifera MAFF 305830]|uniref:Uncharacterized protein n=1 Tax=Serendipita vermifera MAFF 305830 TaxID=933852 RepID=A0A0C2X0V2_SERVB|nr:hypothetical protein M408DRAFT_28127 [Serendipita vermifera MAFF 305830]
MVLPQTGQTSSSDVTALFSALAYSPSRDPATQPKQHLSVLVKSSRHTITFWITSRIAADKTVQARQPTTARSSLSIPAPFQPSFFSYKRPHQALCIVARSHGISEDPGSPISVLPELDPPSSTEPSATLVLETSTILSTRDY